MRRLRAGAASLIAAALLIPLLPAAGCSAEPEKSNLLVITVDTERADRLGCYGYDKAETPAADGLAAEGILFENAYTSVPLTFPAHASLFTSLYPPSHGVRDNGLYRLGGEYETLAEALKKKGCKTGAVIGSYVLDSIYGLSAGFDFYEDHIGVSRKHEGATKLTAERKAPEINEKALEWLNRLEGETFFLWLHYFDPHFPYEPPAPFDKEFDDPYDGEIAHADEQIGIILDEMEEMGLLENTVIFYLSDHGEDLFQHGEENHGLLVYNTTVKIPFIIKLPGEAHGGTRIESDVSIIDAAPTALDILGIDRPGDFRGKSLKPLWEEGDGDNGPVYFESLLGNIHFGWSGLAGFVKGGTKYIHSSRDTLFDLSADPGERENLAGGTDCSVMRKDVKENYADLPPLYKGGLIVSDEESEEKLRSLGYLGSAGTAGASVKNIFEGAHPEDHLDLYMDYHRARNMADRGLVGKAAEICRNIIEKSPGHNYDVRLDSAEYYDRLGEYRKALGIYEELMMETGFPGTYLETALMLRKMGRTEESAAILENGVKRFPEEARLINSLGVSRALAGDMDSARKYFRKAVDLDDTTVTERAYINLVYTYIDEGRGREATLFLKKVLRFNPANKEAEQLMKDIGDNAAGADMKEYYH